MYYRFEEFIKNIELLARKYGEYVLEIMLTDFFCINKKIKPKMVYITPEKVDYGIDAIVIDSKSTIDGKNVIYVLQITTSSKTKKYLKEFKNKELFKIEKYREILKEYDEKNTVIQKIFIALKWKNYYEDFKKKILILSNENQEVNLMLYKYGIEKEIIDKKCEFRKEYIEELKERKNIWNAIHRRAEKNSIRNIYISFLQKNYKFMYEFEGNFIKELERLIEDRIITFVELLNKIKDKDVREEILRLDIEERKLLIDIFEFSGKKKTTYESIIFLIKEIMKIKRTNEKLKNIQFEATKRYITVSDDEKNIAYLYYKYKENTQIAIFCFSVKINELKKIEKNYIAEYLKESIIEKKTPDFKAANGKETTVELRKLIKYWHEKGKKNCDDEIMKLLEVLLEKSLS